MSLRLRPFREPDFETLWQIDQQCFLPGIAYSKRELDLFLRRRGAVCIVAEEVEGDGPVPPSEPQKVNPRILGFVIVHLHPQQAAAHVITIDVLGRARRTGLGSLLIRAAEQKARDRSCVVMHLEAAVDNEGALAFYQRHGYTIQRTVQDYYAPGAHAHTLTKPLT